LMTWKRIVGLLLVGAGLVISALKLGHYYDPAPAVKRLSTKAGPAVAKTIDRLHADRAVYIFLVGLPVCVGALFLFLSKGESKAAEKVRVEESVVVHRPTKTSAKAKTYYACNVLQVGPESRQIWQFDARNGGWFVVGDNPFGSTDSRELGVARVLGVVTWRLWPRPGRLSDQRSGS